MCYSQASYRVIDDKLHIYNDKRRHVCTHTISMVKGSFQRLEEHRRQPQSDWLDAAERMREKWNCTEFQHFINGFKKENPERHLSKQLCAVERYLDTQHPSRALVAEVMALCCKDYRYRFTQFKAVFELCQTRLGHMEIADSMPAADIDVRDLDRYQSAFNERCVS